MTTRRSGPGAGMVYLLAAATCSASAFVTDNALAKHKKPAPAASSDPCAEPTAFIKDHIEKIRTLKATLSGGANKSVASLFGGGGQTADDQNTMLKISDLRHDADGVNDLLRAGGCQPIDIDASLKMAATQTSAPVQTPKKKHHF